MIALLIGWFAPRLGEKWARLAAWAVIIIGAIGLFFAAKALYDRSVVRNHDQKIEAAAAKADRKADEKAHDQQLKDLSRQRYEADQLTEAVNNAPDNPTQRRLALHKCLSLQQRARENGLEPPACV